MRWLPEDWDNTYVNLDRYCANAVCALQIGGDNYSLDYGRPEEVISLDSYLHGRRVPIVLWGASVGPFESDPEFAQEMYLDLRRMKAILVRESESYEYLKKLGIDTNLHLVSDPAFVMEPMKPAAEKIGCPVPTGCVGLNLSPLMAKFVTGGDMNAWIKLAIDIVKAIVVGTHREVLLIPHVTSEKSSDHELLSSVKRGINALQEGKVFCASDNLSAAETKWLISKCSAFIGARTHSTIAAISTGVPTLTLSYSRKGRGLNQDIFGNQDYCLHPSEVSPDNITQRLVKILIESEIIVDQISRSLPIIQDSAMQSGAILRNIVKVSENKNITDLFATKYK
jgi:polysaccharide pyruvyl transferase WcaK-like protein